MNFLFVTPKDARRNQPYSFYLGLAYVSAYMKHKGFNVFCLNTCHYNEPVEQQLSKYIKSKKIDVICTGGMSSNFFVINEILESAKKIEPEIITVVGGPIVTSNPTLILNNMQIDFGIIGEGEETMVDLADTLLNQKEIKRVKGLVFFNNKNKLIINEAREPVDLDILPIPDYEGFEYDVFVNLFKPTSNSYYYTAFDEVRPASIITSRSCPFRCTFCYHPLGNKYRQRSLDNVFKEIDYLVKKYNINLLMIQDELFSADKVRMYEFAKRIKKYNIKWVPQLRVSDVDENLLKILKESGVYLISYGIENLSDTILKSMQKKITKSQIEKALKLTRNAKIAIQGNILFGDPKETNETIKESIDWWINNQKYGLNLYMIMTLPNSPIYKSALSNNLIPNELEYMKKGFPIINLTKLKNQTFKELSQFVTNFDQKEKHGTTGYIISSKKEFKKNNIENTYTLKIKCPECNTVSKYKNMTQMSPKKYFQIICRDCHMRLRVNTKDCFYGNYTTHMKIIYKTIKIENYLRNKFPTIKKHFYKVPVFKKIYYKLKENSAIRSFS